MRAIVKNRQYMSFNCSIIKMDINEISFISGGNCYCLSSNTLLSANALIANANACNFWCCFGRGHINSGVTQWCYGENWEEAQHNITTCEVRDEMSSSQASSSSSTKNQNNELIKPFIKSM